MGIYHDAAQMFLLLADAAQRHGDSKSEKIFTGLAYQADQIAKHGMRVRLDAGLVGKMKDVPDTIVYEWLKKKEMGELVQAREIVDAALTYGTRVFSRDRAENKNEAQRIMRLIDEVIEDKRRKVT